MPLTHVWSFLSPFIALALIGALAMVLRWTFRHEPAGATDLAAGAEPAGAEPAGAEPAGAAEAAAVRHADPAVSTDPAASADAGGSHGSVGASGSAGLAAGGDVEDFGLLGVAAVVETPDAAEQIRAVLADAGIRATVATGRDGRVRVLVFEDEVPRARRVVGWPV